MKYEDTQDQRDKLRKRAEESLPPSVEQLEDILGMSPEEVQRLFHEVKVHQIELEMQNEELRQAQNELEALRDKYLDLYEFAPVGYVTIVEDGLIREANFTACKILHTDKNALINKRFSRFVSESDLNTYHFHQRHLFESSKPQSSEIRLVTTGGEEIHAHLSSVPVRDKEAGGTSSRSAVTHIADRKLAETASQESEQRFKTIFQKHNAIMLLIEPESGKILDANESARRFYGYEKTDLLQMTVQQINALPDDEVAKERDRAHREEKNYFIFPHRLATGEIRTVEVHSSPVALEGKSILFSIIHDITDRKRAEDALSEYQRALQHRTHELAERVKELNCLYVVSRLLETPIDSLDSVLEQLTELLPQGFQYPEITTARIVLDDRRFGSQFHADERPGLLSPIVVGGVQRGFIEVGLTESLSVKRQEAFINEERDLLDAVAASVGNAVERHEAANRLSEEAYFQRSLVEAFPGPLFYKDTDHIYRGCNKAFAEFIGKSREEIVGKSVYDIAPNDLADRYRRQDEELFRNPGVQVYEASVLDAGGSLREVVFHKATFNDSRGNVAGLIGVILDVTERKSVERQLRKAQRLESVGTLAGGIAHDFNNLLTIISGYAELGLTGKKKGDPGFNELTIVLDAAKRGAELVKQILTFSREVETKPKPVNLNHQVDHARQLLYKTIPKMIDIQTHLAGDLKIVMADPAQVEQILLNLAVNARDAMPEGGKLVLETENCVLDMDYCRLHADVRPGEYAAITVSDTGKGMERDVLDRVYEPFFSTKKTGEGTGLGLAMVFGIVKSHNGHITCYSEPGVGTKFKIYFPVKTEPKTVPDLVSSGEFAAFGTETVLLVDDEELIGDLGKRMLLQSGYQVLTAGNGNEALKLYQEESADISLVILDMIMPEMGGKECFEELLKINPNVKVIITSGFTLDAATREALESGALGFISKPFQMDKFLRTVRQVLDR